MFKRDFSLRLRQVAADALIMFAESALAEIEDVCFTPPDGAGPMLALSPGPWRRSLPVPI